MAQVKPVPDGYHSVQPYLYIQGAAEALEFYKKAFGATERLRMPQADGRIGHAEIEIGDSCIMMADENPERGVKSPKHYGGVPMSLSMYVPDCDATYERALAAGAKSLREPADQFYGDRVAGVEDPFGFHWFLATHVKDVPAEELQRMAKQS